MELGRWLESKDEYMYCFMKFCQSEVSTDNRKVSTFFAFQHVRCCCCYRSYLDRFLSFPALTVQRRENVPLAWKCIHSAMPPKWQAPSIIPKNCQQHRRGSSNIWVGESQVDSSPCHNNTLLRTLGSRSGGWDEWACPQRTRTETGFGDLLLGQQIHTGHHKLIPSILCIC